ncbi:alpha-amylase family protein [Marinoscillum furvescens]|nr:hypothetical protein [Marinoscillum furvescens]
MRQVFSILFIFLMIHESSAQFQRATDQPLPTRQVHLDFHTSPFIPEIGARFDKKQFQEALQTGRVNHINIFAKGHHGYSYYPTKVGVVHPNLDLDLLGKQLEACREIGVKAPLYFTVGWSVLDAEQHPEWVIKNADGSPASLNLDDDAALDEVRPHYSWYCLDPTIGGGYHEYIVQNVTEICERYSELDGFWFDIYHIIPASYTDYSLARMRREGVDLSDRQAVERSYAQALKAHMKALRELVASYHPDATVYFNTATHVENKAIFTERLFEMNTQAELEDLPTTWGGYDKLPLEAKYHLQQGTPVVAMSGKFHKAWGEFGGFKHPDAIKYEAAAMISWGAACNFGDQLHPSGEMDMETYRSIGEAFAYVEKIEDYGPGGVPVSKLGLWLSLDHAADHGLVNMLLQTHKDFVVAEPGNLEELELILVPSAAKLSKAEVSQLSSWVAKGGKLILFGASVLGDDQRMAFDIGGEFGGKSEFDFDYTVIGDELSEAVVRSPFLNYESGMRVKATDGKVLGKVREPYFNRTYEKYSSHRETPYKLEDSEYAAVLQKGNIIYFAHDLDKLYFEHGVRLHRQLVANAIDRLYESPIVEVSGLPSSGRLSLLHQASKKRYVAHLLFAPALLRGEEVQVIEDMPPVSGVKVTLAVAKKVNKVYAIPGERSLAFTQLGSTIEVEVPKFSMHTGVVFEYE